MNGEYVFSFKGVRKVNKEYLVEASLSKQLWGQQGNIVGRCNQKYLGRLFLHPREKCREYAGCCAAVAKTAALHASETLFKLVYPEYTWRHRFSHLNGAAHILFALADEAAKNFPNVHAQHRQLPMTCDRLCYQGFSAPLNPEQQHAFWRRQPEGCGFIRETTCPLAQPFLQMLHSANVFKTCRGCVVLKHSRLSNNLLFLFENNVHVEFLFRNQASRKNRFDFFEGETLARLDQ